MWLEQENEPLGLREELSNDYLLVDWIRPPFLATDLHIKALAGDIRLERATQGLI